MPQPQRESWKESDAELFRLLVENVTDYAIFILDSQGHVASWNPGAERIKGYKADEIIGQHFSRFYPQEAIDRGWPEHELKVAKAEGRFEDEGWRVRRDGTQFWANVVITALYDGAGTFRGFSKITRDLTARKQAEENARRLAEETAARQVIHQERERLRVTLASIGDAVISTDAEGRVDFLNSVAQELVGWKTEEAANRTLSDVFRIVNENTRQPVENPALRALKEGKIVGLANHTVLISKDGTERPIDDSAAPIRNQQGDISGSVLVFRDISERKRSEAALNERVRLLALNAAVGAALVQGDGVGAMLQRCAGALVDHLHGAFARIWTLNPQDDVLELQASAGMYTHLDGPHSRVPVGKYKIGLIAQERKPHLTNGVVGDPRVSDQEWAKREGMTAFAGYPLVVDDRLVGVMAMFARQPLSETTLDAMASVADEIAVGIERKIGEERLHQQREWLTVTLASIGDAVLATDAHGRVTFLNGVAQEMTGWTLNDAEGQPLEAVFTIINEQTRQPVKNPVEKVLREGVIVGLANHTVLVARDGTERPIDDSAAPIRDSAGKLIGVVLIFRDVTEQRRAEQELRTSEARKRAILETALDCIITMDHEGRVVEFNPAAEKTFGYKREQVIGQELGKFIIPPSLRERHRHGMAHYLATGEGPVLGKRLELPALRADGTEFPVELAITRINTGGPPLFTAYLRDISERKQAEEEVRFQARLLDTVGQAAIVTDPDGQIIYWNRFAETLYGWTRTEALGRNVAEVVVAPEAAAQADEIMARLRAGENWSGEFRVRRRDGTTFVAFVTDTPLRDERGDVKAIIGISVDISDRKRQEESLRFLADASATLADLVDYQSTLQKVAALSVPRFADWCAVDVAEPGGTLRRLAVAHADEAKVRLAQELDERYPPRRDVAYGAYHVLRTGRSEMMADLPDSVLSELAADQDHLRILRELGLKSYLCVPLQTRGRTLGVVTFVTAESGRAYTESDLAFAEELARRSAIAVESAELYRELRDADRRKDEFLATLAHELRNPLAPIRNGLQVLRLTGSQNEMVNEARSMMERQLRQMVRLVDDLLDVSRITRNKLDLKKQRVTLAAVVHSAVETSRPLIEQAGHTFSLTLPPAPVYLDADLTRLAQVFSNLLNNSAKYTEPGGSIWLTGEVAGGDVVVQVRDTGLGIPADALPRIFEMFSQVDRNMERAQGGLGIGLTLVRRLVEMHGGNVEARSDGPGKGSEFIVRLPFIKEDRREAEAITLGEEAPTAAKRRILVVDDNRDSAMSLGMMLTIMGNEARTAHDGLAAVEAAADFRPDIILLDIGLPKLNGYDACRRIREQPWSKGMVIVALTGWGQDEDRRRSAAAGFDHHMVKPVEVDALERLLAES